MKNPFSLFDALRANPSIPVQEAPRNMGEHENFISSKETEDQLRNARLNHIRAKVGEIAGRPETPPQPVSRFKM